MTAIDGMSNDSAETLLAKLLDHATQSRFVYRHCWSAGDIVIWDNPSVLHRGRPADPSERRVMRRTATADPAAPPAGERAESGAVQ